MLGHCGANSQCILLSADYYAHDEQLSQNPEQRDMLHTRPIKAIRSIDATYYSVMSRHTLPDGRTPDREINLSGVEHLPLLAPPGRLIGDWYRGKLGDRTAETFELQFSPRYIDHLASQINAVQWLTELAIGHEVVVMCIEPTPEPGALLLCHRRLLAEVCVTQQPNLVIDVG